MKFKFQTLLAASFALVCASGTSSAGVITSLYGDVDGSAFTGGFAGTITDQALSGSQSWTQTFAISGTITSATIEIGHAALGYFPPAGVPRLFLDNTLVGNLTDMDACDGSAAPGVGGCSSRNYHIDSLSVTTLAALADGIANIRIETGSGDGWILDYSKLTVNTANVPEPASLVLLGIGLAGLAAARRRRSV